MSDPKDVISLQDIRRLALLSRLTVDEAEAQGLRRDMNNILGHVRQIVGLAAQETKPTTHAIDLPTPLRQDVVQPSLSIDKVLQNAPERIGDGFGVPKIIE